MKQALELFQSKSYLKAEKAFLESEQRDSLESLKHLYLISSFLKKQDVASRYNEYLFQLGSRSLFDEFLSEYDPKKYRLELRNAQWLLAALWERGRLEDFSQAVKDCWGEVIDKKIYSHARSLRERVKSLNPLDLNNHLFYMAYLVETGALEEAVELSGELFELFARKGGRFKKPNFGRKERLAQIMEILRTSKERPALLERALLDLERELNLLGRQRMSPRSLIEYVIIFKDDYQRLVSLLEGELLGEPERLRSILLGEEYSNLARELPPSLRTLLSPKTPFAKKGILAESTATVEEAPSISLPEAIVLGAATSEMRQRFLPRAETLGISETEKEVIARIKADDPDLIGSERVHGVIHSLFGVGFYQAVLLIIEKSAQNIPDNYYVKCQALWELGRHYELADYCEETLAKLREPNERTPFLYMLAQARLQLNQKDRAIKTLSELARVNPGFRNTEELLKVAKA